MSTPPVERKADYTPGLGDLLGAAGKAQAGKVRGPCPAAVVSYDRTTQTASVRPLVHSKGGQAAPVIPRVPVLVQRGLLGGLSITFDLHEGDVVLLIPCEFDISAWFSREIVGEAPTQRRSDYADAVALPGLGTMKSPLGASAYKVGALVVAASNLYLGSSTAVEFVALAAKAAGVFGAIKTWALIVEAAINALAPGTFTPATTLFNPTGVADSVACTTTRAL